MYNRVDIVLTTHDRGSTITALDVKLATRINAIANECGDLNQEGHGSTKAP